MVKLFTSIWQSLIQQHTRRPTGSKPINYDQSIETFKSAILEAYPNESTTLNNVITTTKDEYEMIIINKYIDATTFDLMVKLSKTIKDGAETEVAITLAESEQPHLTKKLNNKLSNTKKNIQKTKTEILTIHPNELNSLDVFIDQTWEEFLEAEEVKQEESYRPTNVYIDKSAVVNLTDLHIPKDILFILSTGPRFCFPPENTLRNTITFLADACSHLEFLLPVETHYEVYKQLSLEMTIDKKTETSSRTTWLDFLRYRMSKFSKKHPDILFTKSDKGKHAVIMHKDSYFEKMDNLVNSTEDYLPIPNIDIQASEDRVNNFVNQLIDSGAISIMDKHKYSDKNTNPSQIYGLIKIHKKDYPVRPIVSSCGSSGFKLAGFLTETLTDIFNDMGHHVKDTPHVIEKIKDVTLDPDDILISFDVVSMFTNIPIDHMITLMRKKQNTIEGIFNINFNLFTEILLYLLRDSATFTWKEKTFRQKDSLAMGSPLSPILAKILMNDILDNVLPTLPTQPKVLALYVDDSFWVVNKNQVNIISETLNAYHPRIRFTNEIEKDKKICFLNLMIHREENELITNWYRKPYASMRLLNYESHHEKACILETAKAYIHMAQKISHAKFFQENKARLIEILRKNSFPENEIITLMHENYSLMKPMKKSEGFNGDYIPLKYRGNLINRFRQKIRPFAGRYIRIVGVPDRCSSKIFSPLKTRIEMEMKSNIILELRCHCKQKSIYRKTSIGIRAKDILSTLKSHMSEGNCKNNKHVFGRIFHTQYKNYTIMNKAFDLLVYANRKRAYKTIKTVPPYFLEKHLDFTLFKKQ